MNQSDIALPAGTELEHYRIDHTMCAGGFGIVYLATDLKVEQQIVIKEYMPNKLAQRLPDGFVMPLGEQQQEHHNEGMRLFLQEAAALVKLKHPNIVRVLNFFRANGTVYMVMEYRPGKNLQSYIKKHDGNLSENFLRTIFPPLLEGLKVSMKQDFCISISNPAIFIYALGVFHCYWILALCIPVTAAVNYKLLKWSPADFHPWNNIT